MSVSTPTATIYSLLVLKLAKNKQKGGWRG